MYRKLPLTILVIMISLPIFGQTGKAALAKTQYEMGAYNACIMNATEGLKYDPSNLLLMQCAARSYVQLNQLEEADYWYKQLIQVSKEKEILAPKFTLEYASVLKKMGKIDEATNLFHEYAAYDRETGLHFASSCGFATELLKREQSYDVFPFAWNSESDDYGVQSTGNGFVFCTFRTDICKEFPQSKESLVNFYQLNSMEEAVPVSNIELLNIQCDAPVNPVLLASSGLENSWIISTGTFQDGVSPVYNSYGDMNIYSLTSNEDGSTTIEPFPFNTIGYSTGYANVSTDGKIMYFASNMPGGYGGFDLYYSINANGNWTTPVNLGNLINTPGNELSPNIFNNELLFASDYHPGLGGFDIFKTVVSNGAWSTIENLGKEVNSSLDDLYPSVGLDTGSNLYFSSNRKGGKGGFDVYTARPHIPVIEPSVVYSYIPPAIKLEDLKVRPSQTEITDRILTSETESVTILNTTTNKEAIPSQTITTNETSGAVSNYFSLAEAQKVYSADTSPEKVYFIQLAAFSKSDGDFKSYAHLNSYGNLYKVHKSNSTKLRLGYFTDSQYADQVLNSVRNAGYKDAFIVIEPLMTSELELLVSSTSNSNSNNTNISAKTPPAKTAKSSHYKIRLASYTDPLWFDTERVKDLGEIEQWTKGNYTIFILSGYPDLEAAQSAMRTAKNRGFEDAHIVLDNNGFLEKLKEN